MAFDREAASIGYRCGVILDQLGQGFGENSVYDKGNLHIEAYISPFPGNPQRGMRILYDGRLVYDVIDGVVKASDAGKWRAMIDELFNEAYENKRIRDESIPWINPYTLEPIFNPRESKEESREKELAVV
jgi:hypothetical protein